MYFLERDQLRHPSNERTNPPMQYIHRLDIFVQTSNI